MKTVVWTPNQFMAVKHVCAIRIQTLINHIGAYHLYFSYLKMPLQSMRIKKKNLSKAPTNWKWKFIYLANKTLQAVKHSAWGVIGRALLVVLALRYVSQLFSLRCVFSPTEQQSFTPHILSLTSLVFDCLSSCILWKPWNADLRQDRFQRRYAVS